MDQLFAKAPIRQVYFKLAFPVVLGMITTMVYSLADTMFVAKTGDTNLVAAVSIGAPLFNFLIAISDIFGLGGSSVISRLFGEKQYQLAKRVSSFCLYLSIVLGLVIATFLLFFEKQILFLLGARASTYQDAAAFYRVVAGASVLVIFSLVPQNLIRTEGLAVEAMVATMVGTISAIILDPIFLFILKLGASGVATANILGYLITDLILIYYVLKKAKYISLNFALSKINLKTVKEIIFIGIPSSIINFSQTFGMALLNTTLAGYGADKIAAMGITQKIYNIVILVIVGFTFGSQPLIGFNYGAKNWSRLKSILRFDFLVQVVYALVAGGILILSSKFVVGLFMSNPAIISEGSYMLLASLIGTPFAGIIMVYTTVFQSVGNSWATFIMAIARQGILYFLMVEGLNYLFGYHGIVWAQAGSDLLTCLLGYLIYRYSLDLKDKIK